MTRKKNAPIALDPKVAATFDELFPDGAMVEQFDYDSLDYDKLGRFTAQCCRIGLLASAYYSSTNHKLCISVRAGERKRAYEYESAEAFNLGIDLVLKQLMGISKGTAK